MNKTSHSQRFFSAKRKVSSAKSSENTKPVLKLTARKYEAHKKIPSIISEIQFNLSLLKKCYEQQFPQQITNQKSSQKIFIRKNSRPKSSMTKQKAKQSQQEFLEEETTALGPELDDLKRSFLSMNGYQSNNVIELYNFYKKNLEKSTRLFGSTSMSNMINITNNHSQIREKNPKNQNTFSYEQHEQKNNKSKSRIINEQDQKQQFVKTQGFLRKTNEMVNVATLLAEKKKISRKNIVQNINSENLLSQAKKKLFKPNLTDNIQKLFEKKQKPKNQNFRISPNKVSKKDSSEKKKNSEKVQLVQTKNSKNLDQFKELSNQKWQQKSINEFTCNEPLTKTIQFTHLLNQNCNPNSPIVTIAVPKPQNQSNALKRQQNVSQQLRSSRSARSVKQFKSPNSIKSPSINQAAILDITGSCEQSSRKNSTYFMPKLHTNTHDSLLDCEITPKQKSKIIDLESIPFDF